MIFIGCFFSYFSWISTLNEAATRAKKKVRELVDDPTSQSCLYSSELLNTVVLSKTLNASQHSKTVTKYF